MRKIIVLISLIIALPVFTACHIDTNVGGKWEDENDTVEFNYRGGFFSSHYYWPDGGVYSINSKINEVCLEYQNENGDWERETFTYQTQSNKLYLYDGAGELKYEFIKYVEPEGDAIETFVDIDGVKEKVSSDRGDRYMYFQALAPGECVITLRFEDIGDEEMYNQEAVCAVTVTGD